MSNSVREALARCLKETSDHDVVRRLQENLRDLHRQTEERKAELTAIVARLTQEKHPAAGYVKDTVQVVTTAAGNLGTADAYLTLALRRLE